MTDRIKSDLTAIRRQLDLPANIRGMARRLHDKFDAAKWAQLQISIGSFHLEERKVMMQQWADYLDTVASGKVVAGKFGKAA